MITLIYQGTDEWDRPIFKGDDEKFYKTTEFEPRTGFESLLMEEKYILLQSLHTVTMNSLNGEPDTPCWKEGEFTLDVKNNLKY
jgi:hypothetical protein